MDFVNAKAQDLLRQASFLEVSQKTAWFVLSSGSLRATDEAKLNAALKWTRHQQPTKEVEILR